jgi:NADPH-dependent glutamate synthase beta subunit-like oxidoreductase
MDRPFAITLDVGSSRANHTGSWRTERPGYVTRHPPCTAACPAGEDCRAWLALAEGGDNEAAWRRIVEDNPFPAVMGRVCYHPCETACNRGALDEAVGINAVERALGDLAIERGWALPAPAAGTGRRVLVVGAGPSGLSAAYHLRRMGHEVEVRDAAAAPGGMMRHGIPRYRLPREVLDAEVARIADTGVRLVMGSPVTDLEAAMREGPFDAVFLAVGAGIGRRAHVPAGAAARVIDAVAFLHDMEDTGPPRIGRRVVVYGGGDTAVDAARTAKRLGGEPVIVYRRTRDRMPAHDEEVREAEEEGVLVRWLSTIRHVEAGEVQVERMELDADGFPQPTGETETLAADTVILALGQDADLALLEGLDGVEVADGTVRVGPGMMTGRPGVFAGGDMVPAERTVTTAVGHGRLAARHVDAWLRGTTYAPSPPAAPATVAHLTPWYYSDAPRSVRPRLEAARRASGFEEVVAGLDADTALYEARRCLSCGDCFECDNCYGVCPDNAIVKLGPGLGYSIDLDYCKGCGICVEECPCGAMEMTREPEGG